MFEQLTIFFAVLLIAVFFHYVIPVAKSNLRQVSIVIWSSIFLLSVAPLVVGVALVYAFLLLGFKEKLVSSSSSKYAWLCTTTVIFVLFYQRIFTNLATVETIGLSYLTLKAIACVWSLKKRKVDSVNMSLLDVTSLFLFFPIFSAGPIERHGTFSKEQFGKKAELDNFIHGFYRILLGIFFISYISGSLLGSLIVDVKPAIAQSTSYAWAYVYLNLLSLYFGFSGYTSIAIGSGRLFGLRIMENFNFPLVSRSVQEFWQRWHLSLSRFLTEYLFRPLMFKFRGKPDPAIFISFVLVGLWHSFSIGYFIWGVGHGAMMVITRRFVLWKKRVLGKDMPVKLIRSLPYITNLLGWLFTLSYISILSVLANSKSLDAITDILKSLFF